MGMEVSEPFDCGFTQVGPNEIPKCDEADIDQLARPPLRPGRPPARDHEQVRQRADGRRRRQRRRSARSSTAPTSSRPGRFWDLEPCADPDNHDHSPTDTGAPHNDDQIIGNGLDELGASPCRITRTARCATSAGSPSSASTRSTEIMDKGMIFDPDHMSVIARDQAMDMVEEADYRGLISSHSWSTPNTLPRMYRLGGVITPYAGGSEGFDHQWQPPRRPPRGVRPPLLRRRLGRRHERLRLAGPPAGRGRAEPGHLPVRVLRRRGHPRQADLRPAHLRHQHRRRRALRPLPRLGPGRAERRGADGDKIIEDLGRGAEAYLQMWERARGIEGPLRRLGRARLPPPRLGDRIRLHANTEADAPPRRPAGGSRGHLDLVRHPNDESKRVKAVFTRAATSPSSSARSASTRSRAQARATAGQAPRRRDARRLRPLHGQGGRRRHLRVRHQGRQGQGHRPRASLGRVEPGQLDDFVDRADLP